MIFSLFCTLLVVAQACRCLPPSVYASSKSTTDSVFVIPTGGAPQCSPTTCWIQAKVTRVWQGCAVVGQTINITTASSSAACGVRLPNNTQQEFLFFGSYINTTRSLKVYSCSYNVPINTLTGDELQFLSHQWNVCTASCAPGVSLFRCFVDPCAVSTCDVDTAECEANYCGGCNAWWFTPNNTRVCFLGAKQRSCLDTGGTLGNSTCCRSTGDFPNTCLVGPCGCAPSSSHSVQTCTCPRNMCFDGTECVSRT